MPRFRELLEKNWCWVILVASFFNQFVSTGIPYSIGIYNVEFLEDFGDTRVNTAWVSSIHIAVLFGLAPLVDYLIRRTSGRLIACLGVAISTIGAILTAFATELFHLYIATGVIMGVGSCMVYLPSLVLVGLHFKRYRTFATAISSLGGSIASVTFPMLFTLIIEKYTWRQSMFIIAGFYFQMMVFSAVLRPVNTVRELNVELNIKLDNVGRCIHADASIVSDSMKCAVGTATPLPVDNRNTKQDNSVENLEIWNLPECDGSSTEISQTNKPINEYNENLESGGKDLDVTDTDHIYGCDMPIQHAHNCEARPGQVNKKDRDVREPEGEVDQFTHKSPKYIGNHGIDDVTRKREEMKYDACEIKDRPKECDNIQPRLMRFLWQRFDVVKTKLSQSILYNFALLIYLINNVLWNIGTSIVLITAADYIYILGASKSQVSFVLMVAGCGDIIGTLLGSIIGEWKHCNRVLGFAILCLLNGTASALYIISTNLIAIGIFASLFGLTLGWFMGWLVSVSADLVGINELGEACGYIMLASGMGTLAGPPLGGWLFDVTGDYTVTFLMGGSVTFASGLLMLIIPLKQIYRQRNNIAPAIDIKDLS